MTFFYANSKYDNWEACRENNIFGIRGSFVDVKNDDIIFLRITGHGGHQYGVKAIWKALSLVHVDEETFVPWADGPYNWIVKCELIVEFAHPFSEEFATTSKKSQKIDGLYASKVMGSLGKLDSQKARSYLNGILQERGEGLRTKVNLNGVSIFDVIKTLTDSLDSVDGTILPKPNESPNPAKLSEEPAEIYNIELDDEDEFPEGKILTRLHKFKERRSDAAIKKKDSIFQKTGGLICEACGFDFVKKYGQLGIGFAECHHLVPISSLEPNHSTRLEDLAIVCSNCHSMIHRSHPMLSINELREVIDSVQVSSLDTSHPPS